MIRIRAVDGENISDVCRFSAGNGSPCLGKAECASCAAFAIARSKYEMSMHVNAVYEGSRLIGFFIYERPEEDAERAVICSLRLSAATQEKKVLEHLLRGLKLQGVRKVSSLVDAREEDRKNIYLSCGFHLAGMSADGRLRYEIKL